MITLEERICQFLMDHSFYIQRPSCTSINFGSVSCFKIAVRVFSEVDLNIILASVYIKVCVNVLSPQNKTTSPINAFSNASLENTMRRSSFKKYPNAK